MGKRLIKGVFTHLNKEIMVTLKENLKVRKVVGVSFEVFFASVNISFMEASHINADSHRSWEFVFRG